MGSKTRIVVVLLVLAGAGYLIYEYVVKPRSGPPSPLTDANALYATGKMPQAIEAYRHALAVHGATQPGTLTPEQVQHAYHRIMLAAWAQAKLGFDDRAECSAALKACEDYLDRYAASDPEESANIQGRIEKLKRFLQ